MMQRLLDLVHFFTFTCHGSLNLWLSCKVNEQVGGWPCSEKWGGRMPRARIFTKVLPLFGRLCSDFCRKRRSPVTNSTPSASALSPGPPSPFGNANSPRRAAMPRSSAQRPIYGPQRANTTNGESRQYARKHREIIAQVEAEPGLPKSLRRYAKKEDEILY